jgi:hypothetical protein
MASVASENPEPVSICFSIRAPSLGADPEKVVFTPFTIVAAMIKKSVSTIMTSVTTGYHPS